jgi:hypothetical protein
MKNRKFDWVIPAIVVITGIFNLLNTNIDGTIRTLWWVLTPVALILLMYRLYQRFQSKN